MLFPAFWLYGTKKPWQTKHSEFGDQFQLIKLKFCASKFQSRGCVTIAQNTKSFKILFPACKAHMIESLVSSYKVIVALTMRAVKESLCFSGISETSQVA